MVQLGHPLHAFLQVIDGVDVGVGQLKALDLGLVSGSARHCPGTRQG